ncbi:hypothetical protein GYMLUDRAFT_245885 [Collybiopsis luxurians FD-317 M1]|uniref:Uncharacterized protein n=1 Tax=Collybiopsis luxurians FD-317 M1 TaxID=944289 RepID=A0A0D0B5Z6_9AGAR|nr:hypothetical protein GYMLUDRAFT_245885 [Collybiopsis luxurians FD-317 M1]
MSNKPISQLSISSTAGYDATIIIYTSAGTPYTLAPHVTYNKTQSFDLSGVGGLQDGDMFNVGVTTGRGAIAVDNTTTLIYNSASKFAGAYTVSGTAVAPTVTFDGSQPV